MGISRKRPQREGFAERVKKWPLLQEKNCHLTWGAELFSSSMAAVAGQNDAHTKVTSLVDYLFFAPIGL